MEPEPSRAFASLAPKLYCAWAVLAISLSLAIGGFSPENVTRLLVLAFLLVQFLLRSRLSSGVFSSLGPAVRFVLLGTLLAAVVEGFHMTSTPVFPSLRIDSSVTLAVAARRYLLDLLFTLPAYLAVFSVIWWFVARYRFRPLTYVLSVGLGQTLGDGGIAYFLASPAMLVFLPYPMTNYHAMNILPYLSVRDRPGAAPRRSLAAFLVVPALIATYFLCGAAIRCVGPLFGFDPPRGAGAVRHTHRDEVAVRGRTPPGAPLR